MENLFAQIPKDFPQEIITILCENSSCRLERILSRGHVTPAGEWLCQDKDEWVIVLRGKATLQFKGQDGSHVLGPGDHVNIPAQTPHRVEWTDPSQETVWLALHYSR